MNSVPKSTALRAAGGVGTPRVLAPALQGRAHLPRNPDEGRHVIPDMAARLTRTVLTTAPALAVVIAVAGCGSAEGPVPATGTAQPPAESGDVAIWALEDDALLNPASTMFVAGVTRLGCASGETGKVLDPQVAYGPDQVVVRTDVAPFGPGGADCQGNDTVPVEVHLDEPLGLRELVDAACVDSPAVSTAVCGDPPNAIEDGPASDEGVRWAPPAGLQLMDGVPAWTPPEDYSFTVQSSCGEQAFIGEYAVTVRGGAVTEVEALRQGWAEIPLSAVPGLAEMLDLARAAAERGEAEIWVDPDGVPRWMVLDPEPRAVDDENCFLVTAFEEEPGV